jgi:anti-sigma factor (TIGR02949 family)
MLVTPVSALPTHPATPQPVHNNAPDIDCVTALRQLWDYLDEELTEDRMAMVRKHLDNCHRCLPHHEFAQRFLGVLHTAREQRLMPQELRTRVMEKLVAAGFSA